MGIKIESCSCFKNSTEIAIEVSMNSLKNGRIKIFAKPEKIELHKSISMGTILSKLSNNENDSLILEKTDIKSLLKNIRAPELIIQSSYNGYSYRKKFNEKKGIKYKLIKEKNKKIKSIENNFISPLTLKLEKLFLNQNFENNWKKYYSENEINNFIQKNNNSTTHNTNSNTIIIQLHVKTECLLSKYKNENCLFQGILAINSVKKNKNQINNIKTFNINSLTGKGSLYLQNGKKFEGNFINGELNGWCRYISDKAICYEGLFIDGVLNGKGEIITINENRKKYIYKGDIINFKKEGIGIEKTNDYNYEGEFHNDIKHGKGKIIFYNNNSESYEGDFKNGDITGKGFYIWKNKHTYLGDFLRGKMHGKGIYKWPDGNVYEGEYIYGIKEGYGEFKWNDGRIYKGPFKNGKQHGKGRLTVNGTTFDAVFEKGKYMGELHNRRSQKK
jgi:hypothetical protein